MLRYAVIVLACFIIFLFAVFTGRKYIVDHKAKHQSEQVVKQKADENISSLADELFQEGTVCSHLYDSIVQKSSKELIVGERQREKYTLTEKLFGLGNFEPVTWLDYFRLGSFCLADSEYKKAKVMFEIVTEQVPDSAIGWSLLSAAYDGLGQKEKAFYAKQKARILAIKSKKSK
jgi:tetratricopeptide (TPR) repeat protein